MGGRRTVVKQTNLMVMREWMLADMHLHMNVCMYVCLCS